MFKKTETIKFTDFMNGTWKENNRKQVLKKFLTSGGATLVLLIPKTALAATTDATFGNVHGAIMNIFDFGVVLVILFVGALWSTGHRSKALELLIGVCIGYLIARHAIDIRNFLKQI